MKEKVNSFIDMYEELLLLAKIQAKSHACKEGYDYETITDVYLIPYGDDIIVTYHVNPQEDEFIEEHTKKPVYNKVIYEYLTPDNEYYRIIYNRKGYISKQNFADLLPGIVRLLAKLIGFEGSYLRFEGEAIIEKIENNQVVEKVVEDSAVWELMYFGKACKDKIYRSKH